MNKKGFVLAEAIVVAVFVLGMFTYLAMNIFPLITKYEQATNYDNPNEIYLANVLYDELVAGNNFDSIDDGIYNFSLESDVVKVKDPSGNEDTSQIFSQEYFRNMIYKQLRVTSIVVVRNYATFDKTKLTRGMRQYYNYMENHNLMAGKKNMMLEFENGKFAFVSEEIPVEHAPTQCFMVSGATIRGWNFSATDCSSISSNLRIPREINGTIITRIAGSAFQNKPAIKSVSFPDTLISIGDSAFVNCGISGELKLPDSLESIGNSAFSGNNISGELKLPDGLQSIGTTAFQDNNISENLVIPSGVKTIGNNTFYNNNIVSLKLNNVESIGSSAFRNNSIIGTRDTDGNIVDLDLTNVKEMGQYAFSQNSIVGKIDLTGITFQGTEGQQFSKNRINSVILGNSVPKYIFDENNIEKITIPAQVETIGYAAFYSNDITKIEFENGSELKQIDDSAFRDNLISGELALPNTIEVIGDYAFSGNSITKLTLPTSLKSVGDSAFCENKIAGVLTIPSKVTSIGSQAFRANEISGKLTFPSKLTTIGSSAFAENKITSVSIPTSVRNIVFNTSSLFMYCAITSITIPSGVTTIAANFLLGNKLTSLTLPSTITSIGASAFKQNNLTSVTLPSAITSIGASAFANNNSLTTITIKKSSATGLTLGANWNGKAQVVYKP